MDVGASEDGAFWLAFLRSLTARGLSGVELVTSDTHQGLKNAIAAVFAGASWQRCRTHFMANLLTRAPKRAQPGVATMARVGKLAHRPASVNHRTRREASNVPRPCSGPCCCSQKGEFSSEIFCNMVSYYRLHRWQLLLTHLIIRATAP